MASIGNMQFTEFLRKAKISGYAAGGAGNEIRLDDGGKKFYFAEGDLEYIDIYYGFDSFTGQETVRQQGKVIWIMNYSGKTSLDGNESIRLYNFLKRALSTPDAALPLRGPYEFRENKYIYTNKVEGNINSFSGQETIIIDRNEVYRLLYHGGSVKNSI
jgi:hypothetical protein